MKENNLYPSKKIIKKKFVKRDISTEMEIAPFGYKNYKLYKNGIMYFNYEGD